MVAGELYEPEGESRSEAPLLRAEGNAFIQQEVEVDPTGSGSLDGLSFAVKDLIDVSGHETGCGNPSWLGTHPPASVHAVCVEQLLASGARCVGKTVCDELAFSLIGENHFYGTPLNPKAPERVPGGSSSGSASAVACGSVDFALGTDTGGSVRVPANNCGIWGMRPSHGSISVAGVNPFAPTFDTVGILANSAPVLAQVASVLLGQEVTSYEEPKTVHLIREAFAIASPDVREALDSSMEHLRRFFGGQLRETSLREIDNEPEGSGEPAFQKWYETYCVVQWAEIGSCLGAWIAAVNPVFGPETEQNFELVKNLDRRRVREAAQRREEYLLKLKAFLGPNDLFCMPTTPALAPIKGTISARGHSAASDYYPRALSLTSIAGIGRLPQVSLPVAEIGGVPVGLSLVAAQGRDAFLLKVVERLAFSLDEQKI